MRKTVYHATQDFNHTLFPGSWITTSIEHSVAYLLLKHTAFAANPSSALKCFIITIPDFDVNAARCEGIGDDGTWMGKLLTTVFVEANMRRRIASVIPDLSVNTQKVLRCRSADDVAHLVHG